MFLRDLTNKFDNIIFKMRWHFSLIRVEETFSITVSIYIYWYTEKNTLNEILGK